MKIHVHIGAHKTGTTFLQDTLAANLAELRSEGIGYLPLAEFRPTVTIPLENLAARGQHFSKLIPRFFGGEIPLSCRGLILSDENLVGSCVDITDQGEPLMSGPRRLKALKDFLAGHPITLHFAIRSYDTFIASAYCEVLRWSSEFVDFSTVRPRLKLEKFDWAAIIDTFVDCLKPTEVKIWRFEDFRKQPEDVLRALAFDYASAIKAADSWSRRVSFSHRAVESLSNIARTAGIQTATQLTKTLEQKMPKIEGEPDFYPWSKDEETMWKTKYAADCARLSRNYWLPLNQIVATR